MLQWENSGLAHMSTQTVTPTAGTDFWKSPRQVVEWSTAGKLWQLLAAEWIGTNNNQIFRRGMVLPWPALRGRALCVPRHHLQFLFNASQHYRFDRETAVPLRELLRWEVPEVTPIPQLHRPCRRIMPPPSPLYSLSLQMTPAQPGGQTQPLRSLLQWPPCRQSSHLRLQSWPNVSPRHTDSKKTQRAEWAGRQQRSHKLLPIARLQTPPVQHKRHGQMGTPEFPSSHFWL